LDIRFGLNSEIGRSGSEENAHVHGVMSVFGVGAGERGISSKPS